MARKKNSGSVFIIISRNFDLQSKVFIENQLIEYDNEVCVLYFNRKL